MKSQLIIFTALLGLIGMASAQNRTVIVPSNIRLPKDSLTTQQLIKTLNGFLNEKERPNQENTFVLKEDVLETSALLDELKGIEKSGKFKDNNFYKCYLLSMMKLDSSLFSMQFSYTGIKDTMPLLRASFRVLVKKKREGYFISSPLKR